MVAAQQLGLPLAVLEVGAPAALADLGVACGDPGAIMYKGRASEALACGERLARPPDTLISCPYEDFADPGRCHVGCDGNLMPCQGISIGNVWQRPLADILATYDPAALPVVREIAGGGPWALARAAGLEPARALYADECHLCYELRSRLRAAGRHLEVLAPDQCYGVDERRRCDDPGGGDAGNGGDPTATTTLGFRREASRCADDQDGSEASTGARWSCRSLDDAVATSKES